MDRERWARRRLKKELELIGDISDELVQDCIVRSGDRMRPEPLLFLLRQTYRNPYPGHRIVRDACSRYLFVPPTSAGERYPRASVQITRQIRRALRLLGKPLQEADADDFTQEAYTMILEGIRSEKGSTSIWWERFGMRFKARLYNLVCRTRSEWGRAGMTGKPRKGEHWATVPPAENLEVVLAFPGEGDPLRSRHAYDAIVDLYEEVIVGFSETERQLFQVDDEGNLVASREVAMRMGLSPGTVKQYRTRARRRVLDDPDLRERAVSLGFQISSPTKEHESTSAGGRRG
jgi:DNA-directed RNA polymerase specialized sigma24 family protein